MGITEILTIIFVVLKLIGKIDWSWWLVLLPEIIACAIYILFLIISIRTAIGTKKAIKKFDESFDKHFREW